MTPCARCGGTVAPDGHCWDRGSDQTDFRAHVASTVDGAAFEAARAVTALAGRPRSHRPPVPGRVLLCTDGCPAT